MQLQSDAAHKFSGNWEFQLIAGTEGDFRCKHAFSAGLIIHHADLIKYVTSGSCSLIKNDAAPLLVA